MYCIEYKCNLFSNLKLKYVSSLIELRGGCVVVLWIVGRGGEGSKPPIVFLRPAISFNPHCLCLCVDTVKVARPFYLVYMSYPIQRNGNIYIVDSLTSEYYLLEMK